MYVRTYVLAYNYVLTAVRTYVRTSVFTCVHTSVLTYNAVMQMYSIHLNHLLINHINLPSPPSFPLPSPPVLSSPSLPSPPLTTRPFPSPPLLFPSLPHHSPICALRTLIKEIQSVIQPFTMVREWPENSDHLSQGLARYSLVTHSFGPLALTTGISSVLTSLDDLQDIYEGRKQLHNPPMPSSSSSIPAECLQMQQQAPHMVGVSPLQQGDPSHLGMGYVKQEEGQHMEHNLDNCPVVMPTQFE